MAEESAREFGIWNLATRPDVVARAVKYAAVVGTILVVINHGGAIFRGELTGERVLSICLTYCVPYAVTTFASVQAVRGEHAGRDSKKEIGRANATRPVHGSQKNHPNS